MNLGEARFAAETVRLHFFFASAFRPVWPGRCIVLSLSLCTTSDSRPGPGGSRTAASCQREDWRPPAIPLHHSADWKKNSETPAAHYERWNTEAKTKPQNTESSIMRRVGLAYASLKVKDITRIKTESTPSKDRAIACIYKWKEHAVPMVWNSPLLPRQQWVWPRRS